LFFEMGACFYPQRPQYKNVRGAYNRGNYGLRPQVQPRRAPVGGYPPQPLQSGRYPPQAAQSGRYPPQPAPGSGFQTQRAVGSNYAQQPAVVNGYPPQLTYPSQQSNNYGQSQNYGPSQGLVTQQYALQAVPDIASREMIHQPAYGPVHTASSWNPSPTTYTSAQPLMGVQINQPLPAVTATQPMWNSSQPTVQSDILPPVNNGYISPAVAMPPAVTFPPVQNYDLPQPQVIHPMPGQQATCRMPALPPCKIDMGMPSVQPSMDVHNNTAPLVQEQLPRQPLYQ